MTYDNDGRFPDGAAVQARYPDPARRLSGDRDAWPWLDATVERQCGPDEWLVIIEDRRLAELEDGTPAPAGTPDEHLLFPMCFRESAELRQAGPGQHREAGQ